MLLLLLLLLLIVIIINFICSIIYSCLFRVKDLILRISDNILLCSDVLLGVLKILLNLTHDHELGSFRVGEQTNILQSILECVFQVLLQWNPL